MPTYLCTMKLPAPCFEFEIEAKDEKEAKREAIRQANDSYDTYWNDDPLNDEWQASIVRLSNDIRRV